jgi:hypothetical protein
MVGDLAAEHGLSDHEVGQVRTLLRSASPATLSRCWLARSGGKLVFIPDVEHEHLEDVNAAESLLDLAEKVQWSAAQVAHALAAEPRH